VLGWPDRTRLADPAALTARLRALAGAAGMPGSPAGAQPDTGPAVPDDQVPIPDRVAVAGAGRAVLLLALAAVAVAGWLTWRAQGADLAGTVVSPGVALPAASATPGPVSPPVVVQVIGSVRRPGVVRLPAGSRVGDALAAAGGLKPGAGSGLLNLARRVVDGEQLVVGTGPASTGSASAPAGSGTDRSSPAGRLDLNSADLAALDRLPGVGPVMAQRILDWRAANGRFASVEQLREVDGVGARTYARLAPLVQVDGLP
jgi:competence protein ComEA